MNRKSETLEQRIVVALQPDNSIRSADVAALIKETGTVIADAEKEQAVDPRSSDSRAAGQAIIDAMCTANRLGPLLLKLKARYQEIHEQEESEKWFAEREATWVDKHDALKKERDALAEELRDDYSPAADRIADLFKRIATIDMAIDELNRTCPVRLQRHLLSVERHARGIDNFSVNTPSLLASVCLFDFNSGRQICPPLQQSMGAAFAATMPTSDQRFSANWWKENEDGAARQRVRQQHLSDYFARTTEEQEARANAEERDRFAAHQPKKSV
jgi:hypothetical protein